MVQDRRMQSRSVDSGNRHIHCIRLIFDIPAQLADHRHIRHAVKGGGQILICTAGEGYYQE